MVNARPTTPQPVTSPPTASPPITWNVETTSAPVPSPDDTSTATDKPINLPIQPMQKYEVPSTKMTLYNSNLLTSSSKLKAWEEVTQDAIRAEVLLTTGVKVMDRVIVEVLLDEQNIVDPSRARRLRSDNTLPVEIQFTTKIQFPSESNDWDAEEMVASAFDTEEKRNQYIIDLMEYDGGNAHFESLESISVEVGGEMVTDGLAEPDNSGEIDGGNDGGGDNSVYLIVAGAVGGACLLLFVLAIGAYYTRRKRRQQKQELEKATARFSGSPGEVRVREVESNGSADKFNNDEVGMEIETNPETVMLNNEVPSSNYFGTINAEGEVDDVSTLGDPYMGDAVDAVMDTDNTVGESMVSSQQEYHVWNINKPQTGMDAASKMGGSTIYSGSKNVMFGDDNTLEDIYRTNNAMNKNDMEDASFQRITVSAPAGKLGIVLDNPHGELPVVYAIKETSALHGKVRVGDLLLSVDGYDCRGMTAPHVSKFLSARSQNPERMLVLVRGVGLNGTVTVAV